MAEPNRDSSSRLGLALFVAYLVITLIGLDRYPLVWVDEGWIAEVAAQAARGLPLGSPSHGMLYRFSDRLFWMPPLYFYELGGVFRMAGIELLAGRMFSVFVGGLTTLALFAYLRRRTTAMAAFAASLFFAADTFVWKMHRTIRFESLLTLFAVLMFITATIALEREDDDRPSAGAWFATGLLAGLSLNVHPNALLVVVAMLAVVLVRRGRTLFRRRGLWLAFGVTFLLAIPYSLYLLSDATANFANVIGQNSFHLDHGKQEGLAPLREWKRWADFFVLPARLPLFVAWVGLVVLSLYRPVNRLTTMALTAFGVFVTLLAFLPNKTLLYLSCAAPFVAIIGASLWERRIVRAALLGGVAASLAIDAGLLWRHRDCRPLEDLKAVRAVLRPEDHVAGTFVTWWATQPASPAEAPIPFHEFTRDPALRAVREFEPDVIIIGDRQWENGVTTHYGRLNQELSGAGGPLSGREPILELDGSCLGAVQVYSGLAGER